MSSVLSNLEVKFVQIIMCAPDTSGLGKRWGGVRRTFFAPLSVGGVGVGGTENCAPLLALKLTWERFKSKSHDGQLSETLHRMLLALFGVKREPFVAEEGHLFAVVSVDHCHRKGQPVGAFALFLQLKA